MVKCTSLNDTEILVLPLQDCSEENRVKVGLKALGLYNLLKAGAAVPSGFCITTSAFKYFLRHDDALSLMIQSLKQVPTGDTDAGRAQELYLRIRQGILSSPLDENLTNHITDAYHNLALADGKSVAVRPSATSEGAISSNPTSHESASLNISSEHELISAVKGIWAGHYADDATLLRELSSLEQAAGVAVIVQSMVDDAKSGIIFTANPSTMDRSTVFIEAASRAGRDFTLGDPTHDKYFVNKVTLEVEKKVLPQKTGASKPCLSQPEINRLVEVGKSVEKYLRHPQEIEWVAEVFDKAHEGEMRFFFIRSRPIALPEGTKAGTGSNIFSFVTSAVNKRVKVE